MQYQHNAYTLAVLDVPTLSGRAGSVGTDRPRISMVVASTYSTVNWRIQQSTLPALTGRRAAVGILCGAAMSGKWGLVLMYTAFAKGLR